MIPLSILGLLALAPEREVPSLGQLQVPNQPEIGQFELSGGGDVWVLERRNFPLIGIEVSIDWDGAIAQPKQRLGARLSSMLMDSGETLKRPEAKILADMGVQWSAGVDDEHLWGTVLCPSGREEEAIKALSALLLEPQFSKRALKGRRAWWASWRDQLAYDLDRTHDRGVNHASFRGSHPWRQMVQAKTIKKLSWRTARKMPNYIADQGQLRIAVVGDTDTANILPVLEAYFGHLKGTQQPHPSSPPDLDPGIHLIDQNGFGVAKISLLVPIPGSDDPSHFVAEALARVLAGRETSRLDLALREEQGLSYAVDTEITVERNWGLLRIDTEVLPENVGAVLVEINTLIDTLQTEGIGAEEFDVIRRGLVLDRSRRLELTSDASYQLAELMRERLAPDAFKAQATAFSILQAEELSDYAKNFFNPNSRTWVITGQAEQIRGQLEELNFTLSTDTDAENLANSP